MTELHAQEWLNTDRPLTLESFRGKVLAVEVFQMLCPGCVSHGLPQAARLTATFPADKLAVIGLHSVFEHHAAMTSVALRAFLHEYRIRFPVAVDQPGARGPMPRTMDAWQLEGTPTLVLFGRDGQMRAGISGRSQTSPLARRSWGCFWNTRVDGPSPFRPSSRCPAA